MEKVRLMTAGIIFLVVALLHLLRLFLKTKVKIEGFVLPLWSSIAGFIVSFALFLWMFKYI